MRDIENDPYLQRRRINSAGTIFGKSVEVLGNAYHFKHAGKIMLVIATPEFQGWEHVSVSFVDRCPSWMEMSWIKEKFFKPEEVVMQLHVAESDHINVHPYVLHLWRPIHVEIPLPPKFLV